jgi:hypothetical protein
MTPRGIRTSICCEKCISHSSPGTSEGTLDVRMAGEPGRQFRFIWILPSTWPTVTYPLLNVIKCLLLREWPAKRCVMRTMPCKMPIAPVLAITGKGKEMEAQRDHGGRTPGIVTSYVKSRFFRNQVQATAQVKRRPNGREE